MSEPLFSIVIPTYNRAGTIGRALDSCVAQTFQSFEIVVVDDDKSKDDMAAALAPYESRCTIRLKLAHHGKAASARNEGVRMAQGRYIAFLDADDEYCPEKLERCAALLEKEPQTLFYSQNYIDRGVGKLWVKPARGLGEDENIFDYLFVHKGWVHPTSIVVDAATAKANPFREDLSFGDDTQFAAELWRQGVKIRMIEEPLTIYHDQSQADRLSMSPIFERGDAPTHTSFMDWVESQRPHMSDDAYAAYRAFFRSRFLAHQTPLRALSDIWSGGIGGKLGLKRCLSQTIQTFAPGLYRKLSDVVAKRRGVDPSVLERGAG